MSPFKVLELNELVMVWLRIYPHHLTANSIPTNDFFKSITVFYISFNLLAFIVTSAMFVYQNTSYVVIALRTGMVVVGSSQALGMFLSVCLNSDKVKMLHQKLQAIVDQAAIGACIKFTIFNKTQKFNRKLNFFLALNLDGHHNIVDMYWEIEQKCCFYTKLLLYYIYGHQMPVVAALSHAIYCICTGDFNTSVWDLPFSVVVPFDTQSIWGWLLKWLFEFGAGFAYILCMIIPTTYFFCFCLYIVAICNHFELMIDHIRFDIEQIQSDTTGRHKHANMWHDVRKNVFQLIDMHVNALE